MCEGVLRRRDFAELAKRQEVDLVNCFLLLWRKLVEWCTVGLEGENELTVHVAEILEVEEALSST